MRRAIFVFTVMILAVSCSASARTWYILPDSTGDAPTIQAGVDSASAGDTVLVASGIYHDCTHWLLEVEHRHCVIMKSGICLRSETGEPGCATIDAERKPASRVIYCHNVDESASIEGFTIAGGTAGDVDSYPFGAGIYCVNSSPRIADCHFLENEALEGCGGAIDWEGGTAVIKDCTFSSNVAGCAGAVLYWGPSATITGCIFTGNDTEAGYGGATVFGNGLVTITGCVFTSNTADYEGGAIYYLDGPNTIADCVFSENVASLGGAISCWQSSCTMTNCTFRGNSRVALYCNSQSVATVTGCTFHGNRGGGHGGGIECTEASSISAENTIIAFSETGSAVRCLDDSQVSLTCCDVYGNAGGDWVGCIAGQLGINGNFSACPSFCNADDGDLHLCDESSCLPGNHPDGYDCGLIGAWGEGCSCGPSRTVPTTLGAIKAMYR